MIGYDSFDTTLMSAESNENSRDYLQMELRVIVKDLRVSRIMCRKR